MFAAYKQNAP